MTARTVNHWTLLPLEQGGRSLIEASAGTGKTWTIAALYLRLLLEQRHSPRQIVVTTFTDAAAQELRERIRQRILRAEHCARAWQGTLEALPGDSDRAWLEARWTSPSAARSDHNRLRLALAELDLAPIGTLHSLCRRILDEFPFECGVPFALGEMGDARALRDEWIDDLWRRLGQSATAPTQDEQAIWQQGRHRFERHFEQVMRPGIVIDDGPTQAERQLRDPQVAQRIDEFLAEAGFKRSDAKLRTRLEQLSQRIRTADFPEAAAGNLARDLAELLDGELHKQLKADTLAAPRTQEFLSWLPGIVTWLESARHAPLQRMLCKYQDEWRTWLARRQAERGQFTFDALIAQVHAALCQGEGRLSDRLFDAWPVALVDEFQDTDTQQYEILDRVYREPQGVLRGRLIMIGDPKQAIYRFRGGDVDAYLAARRSATESMTLDVNFRSSPEYVQAINALYAHASPVLSTQARHPIRYVEVSASASMPAYKVNGVPCARPLHFHYWQGDDLPSSVGERRELALQACADRIVDLLSGGHAIGEQPLKPGDIAVLLPRHSDVTTLRAMLQARAVPCVSASRSNVFASEWALELQVMLHAALHPRDDGAVRAALATQLGGCDWDRLRALAMQPEAWQQHLALFHELDVLWRRQGVLAVVQRLVERASPWLLARADGERALTDLRHLGELLQGRSESLSGRDLLLAWFADQRDGEDAESEADDEAQMRIESESARVHLLTVHASKGLEFNVVMLPLMWANVARDEEAVVLHDANRGQRVLAFDGEARRRCAQEGQDERFRLLYVALTRARHACHVHALPPDRCRDGKTREAGIDPERASLDAMLERLLRDGAVPDLPHVCWSNAAWRGDPRSWTAHDLAPVLPRHARTLPADAPFDYRYSFSALARQAHAETSEESAAGDEDASAPVVQAVGERMPAIDEEPAALAWLAPVAGTEFGNAVHAVFERRRVGVPMQQQLSLIRRALRDERVRLRERPLDELVPHLAERIQGVLEAPLWLEHSPQCRLAALPATALCAEMEFNFVLDAVSLRALREVCDFVPGHAMHELRGLMNGKIDLVFEQAGRFHVLDYKTNRLGDGRQLSAYAPALLDAEMDRLHYRFQALLYTLAVERYLRQRVPGYRREAHLGEAVYLFVRAVGIAPERMPQAGIWRHRFDDGLLDAVDRIFAGHALRMEASA